VLKLNVDPFLDIQAALSVSASPLIAQRPPPSRAFGDQKYFAKKGRKCQMSPFIREIPSFRPPIHFLVGFFCPFSPLFSFPFSTRFPISHYRCDLSLLVLLYLFFNPPCCFYHLHLNPQHPLSFQAHTRNPNC